MGWTFPRALALVLLVPTVLMTLAGVVTALALRPDPDSFGAYSDLRVDENLPTWWSAVLVLVAGLVALVIGLDRAATGRRWWFGAAGTLLVFSLCTTSDVATRIDGLARTVLGSNPLTTDWLPAGTLVWLVLAVPFVVLARREGPVAGAPLLGTLATYGAAGMASELLTRAAVVPTASAGAVVAATLTQGLQIVAAAMLLAVLVGGLPVVRVGRLALLLHEEEDDASVPGVEIDRRPLWRALVAGNLAIALLSLAGTLPFPDPPAKLRQWVTVVDMNQESNAASWFSMSLLAVAALAAVGAGVAARLAGRRYAIGWVATGAIFLGMSLDDMTGIHERLGNAIRPQEGLAADEFPFMWVIPGAAVALLVAAAVGLLALRLTRRPRLLLVGALLALFGFALGLESLEGYLQSRGIPRWLEVLLYHVEEFGENLGPLLLLGAVSAALVLHRVPRGLVVGDAASGALDDLDDPGTPADPAALATEAIPAVRVPAGVVDLGTFPTRPVPRQTLTP